MRPSPRSTCFAATVRLLRCEESDAKPPTTRIPPGTRRRHDAGTHQPSDLGATSRVARRLLTACSIALRRRFTTHASVDHPHQHVVTRSDDDRTLHALLVGHPSRARARATLQTLSTAVIAVHRWVTRSAVLPWTLANQRGAPRLTRVAGRALVSSSADAVQSEAGGGGRSRRWTSARVTLWDGCARSGLLPSAQPRNLVRIV